MFSSIPAGRLSSNSFLTPAITSRLSSGSQDKYSAEVTAMDETVFYILHTVSSVCHHFVTIRKMPNPQLGYCLALMVVARSENPAASVSRGKPPDTSKRLAGW